MTGFGGWSDEEREPVKPMAPHDDAKTKIELFGWTPQAPTIVLSHDAYLDMQGIIQEAGSDEIGWMGTVEKVDDDKYRIEKIFILEQEVSGSHCEFDHAAFGKLCMKLTDNGKNNREVVEKMLFWGHLHPGDMTEPSGQDDNMLKEFRENDFFIRGIFTRGGKCVFTFVDYRRGFSAYDCPWEAEIVDAERQKRIKEEIQEKVSSFRRPYHYQNIPFVRMGERLDIKDSEAPAPPPQTEEGPRSKEGEKDAEGVSSKSGGEANEAPQKETRAPGTPPPLPPLTNVEIQYDGE